MLRTPITVFILALCTMLQPTFGQPLDSALDEPEYKLEMPLSEEGQTAMDMMMHQHETMALAPLGIAHNRFASGTSWMPDSTPRYAYMSKQGKWELMSHGAAHLSYDRMSGPRGDAKLVMPNWVMIMAQRSLNEKSTLQLRGMLSLDPETVGGSGYPLLFQTGETWGGEPLRDHQHPHNFTSELSARYFRTLSSDSAGFLYLAPVGEPALGPPTFMHRTFALDDPLAPIGHHWQDSTHIAFGVVTAGYCTRKLQLEASSFTGREPGENRYTIERMRFDSYSGRISYNPNANLALQVSHGFLNSPEAIHPEENTRRTTASAVYNQALGADRNFQSTFVWGRNTISSQATDVFLVEAQWKQDGGWTPYLRHEYAQKDAEELVVEGFPANQVFRLRQTTIGLARDLPSRSKLQWGLGLQVLLNNIPNELESVYNNNPSGWLLYLRVHPNRDDGSS